jgi:hypothetical protein
MGGNILIIKIQNQGLKLDLSEELKIAKKVANFANYKLD